MFNENYKKEPLKIKLSTFIVFLILLIIILGILSFFYIKHQNDLAFSNSIDVVESKTDNSIVSNEDEISSKIDLQPAYLIEFGDIYYYINSQGYIIFDVVDTNTVLPTIDGFETNFENSKNIERLDDDDIKKLNEINLIMEAAKEQNIYNLISKIIIEDGKYILFSENQKKYIYLGDATDIKTKITYAKTIMEKEKVNGIIYLNGDLQNGFKPYFRENVNAEDVTTDNTNIEKNANKFSNISMDIYIDSKGNASVTEIWNCFLNSGTECYHPYYNLENSEVSNLSVNDDLTNYNSMKSWNTNWTFEEKSHRCGINKVDNGIELCWGISTYGYNTYTIKYDISNFVTKLEDAQMIYWQLIPSKFSSEIDEVDIKIKASQAFDNSISIWGYGDEGGLCSIENGKIHMKSNNKLKQNEYMTILVKLPQNTFDINNNINKSFNYYYEMSKQK